MAPVRQPVVARSIRVTLALFEADLLCQILDFIGQDSTLVLVVIDRWLDLSHSDLSIFVHM